MLYIFHETSSYTYIERTSTDGDKSYYFCAEIIISYGVNSGYFHFHHSTSSSTSNSNDFGNSLLRLIHFMFHVILPCREQSITIPQTNKLVDVKDDPR